MTKVHLKRKTETGWEYIEPKTFGECVFMENGQNLEEVVQDIKATSGDGSKVINDNIASSDKTWSSNKIKTELANNVAKGEKGDKGDKGDAFTYDDFTPEQLASLKGDKGEQGSQGVAGTNGKDGANGKDGVTPNLTIGTVTTLAPSQQATVTIRGDKENPILDFAIPQGAKGDKGDNGESGQGGGSGVADSDKVDYLGHQHDTLKETMDSNVEFLLEEIDKVSSTSNTVQYEGSTITAQNTVGQRVKNAVFKGKSLVNLLNYEGRDSKCQKSGDTISVNCGNDTSAWYSGRIPLSITIERGKQYIAMWDSLEWTHTHSNKKTGVVQAVTTNTSTNRDLKMAQTENDDNNYLIFSTNDELADLSKVCIAILPTTWSTGEQNNVTTVKGLKVFEYTEGREKEVIPYFEGEKTVKSPSLKMTGKNILNPEFIQTTELQGGTIQKTDNGFKITTTTSSRGWEKNIYIELDVKKNTKYTYSCNKTVTQNTYPSGGTTWGTGYVCVKDFSEVTTLAEGAIRDNTRTAYTFTTGENEKIKIWHNAVTDSSPQNGEYELFDFQLEESSSATSYDDYHLDTLTTPEDLVLRANGQVYDELNLITGVLTQRISEDNKVLEEPVTKPVRVEGDVQSYDGVTYYECIVPEGCFQPILSIDVPTRLSVVVGQQIRTIENQKEEISTLKAENKMQDELIDITLMATDEMFMMLEPLLAQVMSLQGGDSKMVDMYVAMVQRGLKTIDQVPARYREQVKEILAQLEG